MRSFLSTMLSEEWDATMPKSENIVEFYVRDILEPYTTCSNMFSLSLSSYVLFRSSSILYGTDVTDCT